MTEKLTASEVLRRYAAGERNFRRVNLRGQSFKGKDLSGADFREADIRGTKFTSANLRGAKFCGVKAGLQKRWAVGLVIFSGILLAISGFFSILILFLMFNACQNIQNIIIYGTAFLIIGTISLWLFDLNWVSLKWGNDSNFLRLFFSFLFSTLIVIVIAGNLSESLVTLSCSFVIAITFPFSLIAVVVVTGTVAVMILIADDVNSIIAGVIIATRKFWIHYFAIPLDTIWGTSFRGADLTDADFAKAILKNTDFRGTINIRTNWSGIKSLVWLGSEDIYHHNSQATATETKEAQPENNIDFIFPNGINWEAFRDSFKWVAKSEGKELDIQSIEYQGDRVIVVKVKVPSDADQAQIFYKLRHSYEKRLKTIKRQYQDDLKDYDLKHKDELIKIHQQQSSDLKEIINILANRPIQNVIENQNLQGDRNMTENRTVHMGSGNYNERIEGDYIQGNYYAAGEKQNLAEAAAEIQALLEQLSKTYPADTTTGKMRLATEVIDRIESNPTLMERILSALKAGSISALEQALNHPAASFVIGALQDWQQSKASKE